MSVVVSLAFGRWRLEVDPVGLGFEKNGNYSMRFQRPSVTVSGKTDHITIYTTELSRMPFHGKMLYIIAVAPSDEYHDYSGIFQKHDELSGDHVITDLS